MNEAILLEETFELDFVDFSFEELGGNGISGNGICVDSPDFNGFEEYLENIEI